jgi:hypothetical protein
MNKRSFNEIKEFLEDMDEMDVMSIWNDISSYDGRVDSIYDMDSLDDFFGEMRVSEFLDKLDGDFNHRDNYFYDTIWGIASTDDIFDVVDIDELAYILEEDFDRYENWIWNEDIKDFMNEEAEEDFEDEEDFEEEAE